MYMPQPSCDFAKSHSKHTIVHERLVHNQPKLLPNGLNSSPSVHDCVHTIIGLLSEPFLHVNQST